jgi:hypothetical protein
MAARPRLQPKRLAPFFIVAALVHALAIATRFDELARMLPPALASTVLLGSVAMLFIEGYFEGRLDYGPALADLPLWMRIKSGPVRAAFTLAFTYLLIVAIQTWDVSIGPFDLTPAPDLPLQTRAIWFGVFVFGGFFVNYMAVTSLLIPGFRAITAPLRWLPGLVGVSLAGLAGVGVGWALTQLVASVLVKDQVAAIPDLWTQISEAPETALPVALATVFVPILVGMLLDARKDG